MVLPEEWPRRGAIVFDHVSVRYRENLDPVLIDVCLEFRAGEKIGIVGRTGSGKSTLALSIFRLIEADKTGRICIDDVDIATIGLRTLRSRIAIIPQGDHLVPCLLTTHARTRAFFAQLNFFYVLVLTRVRFPRPHPHRSCHFCRHCANQS